ncbi:hypothetical protein HW49_09100 [Porphyromonadaceae bacterium COT-184 OH4590]|nr:hypothetical protein HW49_09100 [Porphyromonadaceae bacterium COT-184 OH4590]
MTQQKIDKKGRFRLCTWVSSKHSLLCASHFIKYFFKGLTAKIIKKNELEIIYQHFGLCPYFYRKRFWASNRKDLLGFDYWLPLRLKITETAKEPGRVALLFLCFSGA